MTAVPATKVRYAERLAEPGESLRIGGVEVDVSVDALYASALPAPGDATGRGDAS